MFLSKGDIVLNEIEESQHSTLMTWWEQRKTIVIQTEDNKIISGLKMVATTFPETPDYDIDGLSYYSGTVAISS